MVRLFATFFMTSTQHKWDTYHYSETAVLKTTTPKDRRQCRRQVATGDGAPMVTITLVPNPR